MADNSINLEVLLPSGRRETVSVLESGTIADLKIAAQQSFNSLRLAGLCHGDSIAAAQPKMTATRHAFALCWRS